jgi:hypothetical protein
LQLLEQHVTSSQHLSHFFLHVNGRPQTTQIFSGKLDLLGFFSFFPSSTPLRPNNRHGIRCNDDGTFSVGREMKLGDKAVLVGRMKEDEHPMAQPDTAQNEITNLLHTGMVNRKD